MPKMKQFKCIVTLFVIQLSACSPALWSQTSAQPAAPDAAEHSAANGNSTSSADAFAPTTELNKRLPSWLSFYGRYRLRSEGTEGIKFTGQNDTHLLSRLRFGITIRPAEWLTFVGELQDSRIIFNSNLNPVPPYQNTWDLRQAYGSLTSPGGWLDVKVGRQVLAYGEERLIGPSEWVNQGRTFDAIRLDLHGAGNEVSLFASSVVLPREGVLDHHLPGNNLYGIYGSIKKLVPKAAVDPYVLWRVAPANVRLSENAGRGALDEVTAGFLWKGDLPAHFDYDIEMVRQMGSLGPDSIHSWAGHWGLARTFTNLPGKPRPFVELNYASGTKDPASHRWSTFDQIYPSSHDKLGFADQVGWRNIQQVEVGVKETIGTKWKLRQSYENFWLATARDGLYASNGSLVAQSPDGSAGTHVGQEIDLIAEYKWSQVLDTGFGYCHIFTGEFLNRTTHGKDYNYPYVFVEYKF